jgi:DNA-binding transcriptional regulator YhcF (GntR family)/predicted kinase
MVETPSPLTPGEPKQAQIVRLVRTAIEAGTLRDGEVLPSTRELAQRWGVSVYTINQAMGTLSELGFVVNVDRAKRVVRDPSPSRPKPIERRTPAVIFVGGYAGSGKTEFGRILARRTGWPILDKDTTTRPVVELALEVLGLPGHDRESADYLSRIRPREYEALIATATENVECGVSAIVTAPFIKEYTDAAWLSRTTAMVQAQGARVVFAWIKCDVETMHTYIRHRGAARDAGKLANWDTYAAGLTIDLEMPVPHVVIDNSADAPPLQDQAEQLLRELSTSTVDKPE